MTDQDDVPAGVLISLPRPQRPALNKGTASRRFESLHELLRHTWRDETTVPSHAWIRPVLSTGLKQSEFAAAYQGLAAIKTAFGRRTAIVPVVMDHHEVEIGQMRKQVNPETGQHEIELHWVKQIVDGGTHFLIAVESCTDEENQAESIEIKILDAIESSLRISLGVYAVIDARHTKHIELSTGRQTVSSEAFHVFGPEEYTRSDEASLKAAAELVNSLSGLSEDKGRRLLLGLHWMNTAFSENELLSFWTAFEILAGGHGEQKVFKLLGEAYQHNKAQQLARTLGVKYIAKLRNDLVHNGLRVYVSPGGASFLLAVGNDLARQLAGLSRQRATKRVLEQIGGCIQSKIKQEGADEEQPKQ